MQLFYTSKQVRDNSLHPFSHPFPTISTPQYNFVPIKSRSKNPGILTFMLYRYLYIDIALFILQNLYDAPYNIVG